MSAAPERPMIYHITHVDNLERIVAGGGLVSDRRVADRGGPETNIGMSIIKQRRLTLPVACHLGTCVGDYVPFYFCPRSVMLYVIHCANHPELGYLGGQGPIVHLEADLKAVVTWATRRSQRWAFTPANAGSRYVEARTGLNRLNELDWASIANSDFRNNAVKEAKQSEFLVHDSFPWNLVERIGVNSPKFRNQVDQMLRDAAHQPRVSVMREWYC